MKPLLKTTGIRFESTPFLVVLVNILKQRFTFVSIEALIYLDIYLNWNQYCVFLYYGRIPGL